MKYSDCFVDLLKERRKDCDIKWVSRPMDPLLPHKLPKESSYSREKAIETVLNSLRVKTVIKMLALVQDKDEKVLTKQARAMLNEMASKANLATVRWLGLVITKVLKKIFLSIYINEQFLYELKNRMRLTQVQYVYVPSHRSYLDFILLSYILFCYDMALPNIASGMDFYHMYIIGEMLRKTGAFYMRRSFTNDPLYKEIFRAYVTTLTTNSDRAVEFFIEGTRSRSQKSIVPKYGLLSNILEGYYQGDVPDIHFVPISISYDRPPEESLFVYELLGVPKPQESTAGLLKALSILKKPYSHGCVYFNIAESISARQFVSDSLRKERVLSPHSKLPLSTIENLAYTIIESQKQNTVLTSFNVIALLFNDRIQMCPESPYTLDTLIVDYLWCWNFMTSMGATIQPEIESNITRDGLKDIIFNALKPHEELLILDALNNLRLGETHKQSRLEKYVNVKGHTLNEETMKVAVPAINIMIYVNPTFAFLTKPAFLTATIDLNGIHLDEAFERYVFLRTILSTEFALPLKADAALMKAEWEEILSLLYKEDCLRLSNESLFVGANRKLYHLLHNLVLPYLDTVRMTYAVLSEWDNSNMGEINDRKLMIETQRQMEHALSERKGRYQHPYSLSLDLVSSTLFNLTINGAVFFVKEEKTYRVNRNELARLIVKLDNLPLQYPTGIYMNINLVRIPQDSVQVHAKL